MKTLIAFLKYGSLVAFLLILDACKHDDPPQPAPGFKIKVTDKAGKSIPVAKVEWNWIAPSASQVAPYFGTEPTNSDGIYLNDNVGAHTGQYSIKVTATGYKIVETELIVSPNEVKYLIVPLEIEPPLELIPSSITFSDNESEKPVRITNNSKEGSITLGDIVIPQTDQWVKLSTPSTIPANSTKDITVTVDRKGRGFGSYNSTITFNYTYNGQPFRSELNVYMLITNPQAPSIIINDPTGITQTSADLISTVTNLGGSPVTDRGIYWSDGPDPQSTTAQKKSSGPGVIGSFQSTINGLKPGTKYYVRAYAVNANGTGLSAVKEFTTAVNQTPPSIILDEATNVALNSADLTATITNNGGSNITSQVFCWNTTGDPKYTDTQIPGKLDNGRFTATMTGLAPGIRYYVKAYAINGLGSSKPGPSNVIDFTTQVPSTPSVVSTNGTININETSATLQGTLTKLGSSPITQHGFCWSTTNALPAINDKTKTVDLGALTQEKSFSYTLTGLTKGTNYYVRAYVLSSGEPPVYGLTREVVTTESGLALYYPFNGDASDKSGFSNDADSKASLTEDRFGNPKRAYDISSGGINVVKTPVGSFESDVTYSFWAKISISSFSGSKKIIMGKEVPRCFDDFYYSGFILNIDPSIDSRVRFYIQNAGKKNANPAVYEQSELADQWRLITIVKSGQTVNFYLDKAFIISQSAEISTPAIDYYNVGGAQYSFKFDGRARNGCDFSRVSAIIDDVRIYNRALTAAQVEELYNR